MRKYIMKYTNPFKEGRTYGFCNEYIIIPCVYLGRQKDKSLLVRLGPERITTEEEVSWILLQDGKFICDGKNIAHFGNDSYSVSKGPVIGRQLKQYNRAALRFLAEVISDDYSKDEE
jgi:hypothetical protein